ncbi:MAG: FAD-dependent oxidoreductase, partial [Syntrophothermus sp.]
MEKKQKIGVYICHCGGNISDYVDVEHISDLIGKEDNVAVSKNVMFACADSNQKEMVKDIQEKELDGIVVSSCSPKLHLHTFRNVASRGGLNPYNYIQVNIREQCSWPHSDDPGRATAKATGLIRGGINRIARSEGLETMEIDAVKTNVVVGAGVSGMRAAIELARMGNEVFLVEKEDFAGGRIAEWGDLFISGQNGKQLVDRLLQEIRVLPNITLFTGATLEKVTGSVGNFNVSIRLEPRILDENREIQFISVTASSVLVTTGYDSYVPSTNELGYQTIGNVITLPELRKLINENHQRDLFFEGKKVKNISFIYCVGSRQQEGENKYCSRICCTTAVHTSLLLHDKFDNIRAYHLYRDMRT